MQASKNQRNIVWQEGQMQAEDRQLLLKQKPLTIWLTGLSASGKSTLAFALERKLYETGHICYVLDGDNVRHGLTKDLDFSPSGRTENIRRISEVAHLMNDAGLIVITAFISPYREDRALAKKIVGENQFAEIYVSTPIETCEARDPKGLYKRARAGEVVEFTGIDAPYEPPINPDVEIDTSTISFSDCLEKILTTLKLAST